MVSATFIGLLHRVLSGVRVRRVFYIKAPSSGRLKTGTGAMIINMIRCAAAEALLKRGVKPVILPSHQFVGNTSASEQLETFYEAYRQSLKHLFE
jgi:hypothetical protein